MSAGAEAPVLLTGATGYIGGRLVPRLLARGVTVRCLVRDPRRLDAERWRAAARDGARLEVVTGDALRPETLPAALAGCRAAYYLIHSLSGGERGFAERDRSAARHVAAAAAQAGVQRLIYLGGLGDSGAELSEHLASRQQTGEALRSAGVPVTELRAAVVVGSGSISFEVIRYLVERLPVLVAPRWTATRCQPIAVRDVLDYLLAVLDEPAAAGRVLEIGGADVLTYGEMLLGYAHVRGLRRWLINVPVLTPRLSSLWVNLVTPIPSALARPLIDGLRTEVVVRDDAVRRLFPHIRPLGYAEAVRRALVRGLENAVETAWSDSSSSAGDRAPAVGLSQREGLIVERRERDVAAPPRDVWCVVASLGGRTGWLYANWLWELRGLLDRVCGGPGLRRGRRDAVELRAGDACDFWRVLEIDPRRRLLLGAEMKLPGRAWLELVVEPRDGGGSRLRVTAIFEPRGLLGLLYWWSLYPAHAAIFSGLVRRIAQRAVAPLASDPVRPVA